MIRVFDENDRSFTTNGDCVIQPLKAKVHKEDNGDYYLDFEAGLQYVDYLVSGKIIVADTPQGAQPFRISGVGKKSTKIALKAWHVFYDTKNYLIADSNVVDKNCNDALDHLNSATEPQSAFTTISDVQTVDSFRCVRKSLYEAIQEVIERWGGHLVRDNFKIEIRAAIGVDNGVTVRYKKNLKEITCEENWDCVVTKLLPVGRDGILLNDIDKNASIYVVSSKQYDIPYTKTVSFDQDINEDDYKDADGNKDETAYRSALVEDLRQQAQEYVEKNCVPQINYTINANVEKITDIGDTVEVLDERLGINLLTNVIAFEYDCILGKYTQIELGNFTKKLSGLISGITTSVEQTVNNAVQTSAVILNQQMQDATDKIMGVIGSSYVIYEGDKILVVDSLPKESAKNVIMINNAGIGFSNTGINGIFTSAWLIDGTLNMQAVNVINLVADMIKGGTLKLGSNLNQNGQIEVYDETNRLIVEINKNGIKMHGSDGSYVVMNEAEGLAGYDFLGNKIYWVAGDEFHMKKSVIEEEITLCSKMRFIPIEIKDGDTVVNDGIGLVSVGD